MTLRTGNAADPLSCLKPFVHASQDQKRILGVDAEMLKAALCCPLGVVAVFSDENHRV